MILVMLYFSFIIPIIKTKKNLLTKLLFFISEKEHSFNKQNAPHPTVKLIVNHWYVNKNLMIIVWLIKLKSNRIIKKLIF